jgi:hypothetical protein
VSRVVRRTVGALALPVVECRSCHGLIVWARTEAGKRMPLDAEPDETANVLLERDLTGLQIPRATVFRAGVRVVAERPGTSVHRSHFATCPFAATHRRPRRGR